MAIIQISRIQNRTGNIDELPQLTVGELGWASDARRLFIGNDPDVLGPNPDNTEILTQYSEIQAAGANTQVQFNQGGTFGASNAFTFNSSSNALTLTGTLAVSSNASFGGNVAIAGNLSVSGNITYYDIINSRTSDPIIELGGGANGAPLYGNDGKDRGTLLHYYTTTNLDAFMGWDNSNGEFAFGSNVTNVNDVITFNTLGNVRAQTFIGNVVGNVSGNIIGNIAVPGANTQVMFNNSGLLGASPNMTFNGTTLSVIGAVSATSFAGNGANLTNITGANVTGAVANATYATSAGSATSATSASTAGTVTTAAQPNITSVGTLTSLTVSGNISGGNIDGIIRPTAGNTTAGIIFPANPGGGGGDLATIQYYAESGEATVLELKVTNDAVSPDGPDYIRLNATGGTVIDNTLTVANLSAGSISTPGSITGNWTLAGGSKINATYADLAEYYLADAPYAAGTVLAFGGAHEVTVSDSTNYQRIAGVVTTNPAYVMNVGLAETGTCIALAGRVPVRVTGKINKGDLLRASPDDAGVAVASGDGGIIGRAIQPYDSVQIGTIEVMVGRT